MRMDKTFAVLAVVAGMALTGAPGAKAQDGYGGPRRDARIERLQNNIARDRWRLDNDIQRGKGRAASHAAGHLAKDQRKLGRELRRR
jgi:hypothetical protein